MSVSWESFNPGQTQQAHQHECVSKGSLRNMKMDEHDTKKQTSLSASGGGSEDCSNIFILFYDKCKCLFCIWGTVIFGTCRECESRSHALHRMWHQLSKTWQLQEMMSNNKGAAMLDRWWLQYERGSVVQWFYLYTALHRISERRCLIDATDFKRFKKGFLCTRT